MTQQRRIRWAIASLVMALLMVAGSVWAYGMNQAAMKPGMTGGILPGAMLFMALAPGALLFLLLGIALLVGSRVSASQRLAAQMRPWVGQRPENLTAQFGAPMSMGGESLSYPTSDGSVQVHVQNGVIVGVDVAR